jgi:hypothetical protein
MQLQVKIQNGPAHYDNTSCNWSVSPQAGSVSATGLFSAPSKILVGMTVVVTATLRTDPTKTSQVTIALKPSGSRLAPRRPSVRLGARTSPELREME